MRLPRSAVEKGRSNRSSAPLETTRLIMRGVLFPGRDDDHDEGIVARAALAQLLDGGAKLFGGALRFAQRDVGRRLLHGIDKGFEG